MKKFKDPVSGFIHFLGVLASVAALVILILRSSHPAKPWHIVSFSIYGAGMLLSYTASTVYHWLNLSEENTLRLRRIDHMMIFIFIASTYTPICLIPIRGGWGWTLFGLVWATALIGIILKTVWMEAPRRLATAIYVLMGWLAVIALVPLVRAVGWEALVWLLAGGLFYTIGAVIYSKKWPNPFPPVFGFHEIFHLFVILGSVCHFILMVKYIVPLK
ncbi:MAG: hemolysin III family protein [Candidatus Neomarinimicrobiota bacterium]